MNIFAALARGRRRAEALMIDTCRVYRPSDEVVTDPVTGEVTAVQESVYVGKCKIQAQRMQFPEYLEAGEHRYVSAPTEVHFPVDTPDIKALDIIEITASYDPNNVGRKFVVQTDDRKSLQTAVRVIVKEYLA